MTQMNEFQENFFEEGAQFLQLILEQLESADIPYCIERNYEEYPNIITGDIDFLVLRGDLEAAVRKTQDAAKQLGWNQFISYVGNYAAHLGFHSDECLSRFVLVIEFFVGAAWRGLHFLFPERTIQMRQRHKSTWKPDPSHEAIITLIHHLLYNHRVYEKYHNRIKALVVASPKLFEEELSFALGPRMARAFTGLVLAEDWDGLENQSGNLRHKFLVRSFVLRPLRFIAALCKIQADIRKKPEGVVISLDRIQNISPEILADEIIELAVRWHIFMPPNRKKIMLQNKNAAKLVESIAASGGVAVVLNPLGEELAIKLHYPIIHVDEQDSVLSIRIGNESVQKVKQDSASLEIWNIVLHHRSKV